MNILKFALTATIARKGTGEPWLSAKTVQTVLSHSSGPSDTEMAALKLITARNDTAAHIVLTRP
eukprot:5576756-Karenia_brevis.AAC.1